MHQVKNLRKGGYAITTSVRGLISASDCPPHFAQFLKDLLKIIDGTTDSDASKDKELSEFTSDSFLFGLSQILSHAERILYVIQKWEMAGIKNWLDLIESGGEEAVHAEIEQYIREGRAPAEMFFDPAAWGSAVEDSEHGRKLNIQNLPDSARSFFCNFIEMSEYQIDPDLEGLPDYELYLFLEGLEYLDPKDIISHMNRLLEGFFLND